MKKKIIIKDYSEVPEETKERLSKEYASTFDANQLDFMCENEETLLEKYTSQNPEAKITKEMYKTKEDIEFKIKNGIPLDIDLFVPVCEKSSKASKKR